LKLWHEKFGHLGKQNLKFFVQKNLVTHMDVGINQQFDFCVGFDMGSNVRIHSEKETQKNAQNSFGIGAHRLV
jgi:hypothetical protein